MIAGYNQQPARQAREKQLRRFELRGPRTLRQVTADRHQVRVQLMQDRMQGIAYLRVFGAKMEIRQVRDANHESLSCMVSRQIS